MVIASERARRPHDFARQPRAHGAGSHECPFCAGNEAMTPPEVMAYRPAGSPPDSPGWSVRVVPNLYPAFGPAGGELRETQRGLFLALNGLGAHEVLIASPEHVEEVATLPTQQLLLMARSYVDRYLHHKANPVVKYVHIIMNYGREAGASREHPHSQLFAIPLVPGLVETELWGAGVYYEEHGRCVFCDLLQQELTDGARIVLENDRFVVFAPFASRSPFEMWLVPKEHRPNFEASDERDLALFAAALKEALGRLYYGLNDPPFNYWIHTSPTQRDVSGFYHWHLELLPKLSIAAGFEMGTEIMINTAVPETAAAFLREIDLPQI